MICKTCSVEKTNNLSFLNNLSPKIIKTKSPSIITMIDFDFNDPFRPRSKKQRQKDKLSKIRSKGKAGEDQVQMNYMLQGYKMERTGRGHDFKATRTNYFTGRTETKYVEVKTGNAQLSPLQRKSKKKHKGHYVEERVDPWWH